MTSVLFNIVQQPAQGLLIIIVLLTLDYNLGKGRRNVSEMMTKRGLPSSPSKSIAPASPWGNTPQSKTACYSTTYRSHDLCAAEVSHWRDRSVRVVSIRRQTEPTKIPRTLTLPMIPETFFPSSSLVLTSASTDLLTSPGSTASCWPSTPGSRVSSLSSSGTKWPSGAPSSTPLSCSVLGAMTLAARSRPTTLKSLISFRNSALVKTRLTSVRT